MELTIQQGHVLAHPGDLLVVGGPGSGKTTIALLKARQRVAAGLEPGQAVLFLSFSRGAVTQIQNASRIALTPREREGIRVHTFHSFAWEVLRTHGQLLGLPQPLTLLTPDEVKPLCVREPEGQPTESCLRTLAFRDGKLAFDLFLPLLRDLLTQSGYLRRLYSGAHPLVVVDEFQDTDETQLAVINAITEGSTLMAMGDPDQRIYDYRPGVATDRISRFVEERTPKVFTFIQNHRSPGRSHLAVARHVLQPDLGPVMYDGLKVEKYRFPNSIPKLLKGVVRQLTATPLSQHRSGGRRVAILCTTNQTVRMVSNWLTGVTSASGAPVAHEVITDTEKVVSAWRFALSLIDGAAEAPHIRCAYVLRRLVDHFVCASGRLDSTASRLTGWADEMASGRVPKQAAVVKHLQEAIQTARETRWSGDVSADMQSLRAVVARVQTGYVAAVADVMGDSNPFRRGTSVERGLSERFSLTGTYSPAEELFRRLMATQSLVDWQLPIEECAVMTIHKSKGKEFDAVVIFDGSQAPHQLVLRDDPPPHEKSRKLLHVAMTRARECVVIFTPEESPCPLLPPARRNST